MSEQHTPPAVKEEAVAEVGSPHSDAKEKDEAEQVVSEPKTNEAQEKQNEKETSAAEGSRKDSNATQRKRDRTSSQKQKRERTASGKQRRERTGSKKGGNRSRSNSQKSNTNVNKQVSAAAPGGTTSETKSPAQNRRKRTNSGMVNNSRGHRSRSSSQVSSSLPEEPVEPIQWETLPLFGEHKLHTAWSFWYSRKSKHHHTPTSNQNQNKGKKQANSQNGDLDDHKDHLTHLSLFRTVEEFWSHYCWLKRPEELPKESNYYVFRKRLLPMWETFPKGGCFIVRVRKEEGLLDQKWEELVMAALGEEFEDPAVVGVVVSIRSKENVLSVWLKHTNPQVRNRIGYASRVPIISCYHPFHSHRVVGYLMEITEKRYKKY
ncbi:putative Eukaryotic translation initiation factor 4E type, variant 2 [Balamuthia mandrillaris]